MRLGEDHFGPIEETDFEACSADLTPAENDEAELSLVAASRRIRIDDPVITNRIAHKLAATQFPALPQRRSMVS